MIDLKKYRVIDLSKELRPGIYKANGEYTHSRESRRLELRQWIFSWDKTFMHWVETETHIGTHVECPAHLRIDGKEGGKTVSEMPLETWMGEASVFDFTAKKPKDGKGQPITPDDLRRVKEGDIVLTWSPHPYPSSPYLTDEAVDLLIKRKIKQIGIQDVGLGNGHDPFLKNEIPIVEGLVNLDKIRKERVFYIGLVLNWYGLDSCWIRAIALEEP